ncbi:MAG: enoyl-CoA hydratase/isomerase family protein [bacterium]
MGRDSSSRSGNGRRSPSAYACLRVRRQGRISTVTMNRPQVFNALNVRHLEELKRTFEEIGSERAVSVVILEGAGGNFCSGADMTLLAGELDADQWRYIVWLMGSIIRAMRVAPQAIVTKIRGVAYGAGANMALAGDFALAAHDARFCQSFVKLGAVLDGGGTYFLPRLAGMARAKELALLGEAVDGRTAAAMGLIHRSFPDERLDDEVRSLAEALLERSSAAIAEIKEGLERSLGMSLEEALEWEVARQTVRMTTPEVREAGRRFYQAKTGKKRPGRGSGAQPSEHGARVKG